jgi:hypothetical protein
MVQLLFGLDFAALQLVKLKALEFDHILCGMMQ